MDRSARHRRKAIAAYLTQNRPAKLHIGCGDNVLGGWLNTEYENPPPKGGIFLDASKPFPIGDAQFDFIFSEHMIEHIDLPDAHRMLQECHRILRPKGHIRIATPRLEFLAELMLNPSEGHHRYAEFHYAELSEPSSLKSPAGVVNDYFRLWGHRFVHDESSVRQLLSDAGFVDVTRQPSRTSTVADLHGLEYEERMPAGLLALTTMSFEAMKPG